MPRNTVYRYRVMRVTEENELAPVRDADGEPTYFDGLTETRVREAALAAALLIATADPDMHFVVTGPSGETVQEFLPTSGVPF